MRERIKMSIKSIDCIYGKTAGGKTTYVSVPGSKSITNRALLLSAMAKGESVLRGAFMGGDFFDLVNALDSLGIKTEIDKEEKTVMIKGCGGHIEPVKETIYVGSAGTAARFLTALLGNIPGTWKMDASEQMRKRPMAPLLDSLMQMGCTVEYEAEEGRFPFTLHVPEKRKSEVTVDIDASSQFLSALMIAGIAGDGLTIHIKGSHGMNYVKMTENMMREFGAQTEFDTGTYIICPMDGYNALDYNVEPDISAACYFYAAAAILGERVCVNGVRSSSSQGDIRFLDVLCKMGCMHEETDEGIIIEGPKYGKLSGIEVDMHAFSDQALTLAAIAPFAAGPTVIKNVAHIRGQECDRIEAIRHNLNSMGIECEVDGGNIKIFPHHVQPAMIKTYGDHRVAMSFSVTGLRAEGIQIDDAECTRKTFGEFFEVLEGFCESLKN